MNPSISLEYCKMAKTGRPYSDSNGQWQPPCFSYRRMWLNSLGWAHTVHAFSCCVFTSYFDGIIMLLYNIYVVVI